MPLNDFQNDPGKLLLIIDGWLAAAKEGGQDLSAYRLEEKRINHTLQKAAEMEAKYYYGLSKPSPIKTAACMCYAIALEQPLRIPPDMTKPESHRRIVARMAALDNAQLAFDAARYMVATAKFECRPEEEYDPPFALRVPSKHFRREFTRSLAVNELTVPGIAYVLELLLYSCDRGKSLPGALDEGS